MKAYKQNKKEIKITVSLKIDIKEKSPYCGLTFHSMQSFKTIYYQKEKLMLNFIKQTVSYMLNQTQVIGLFVLASPEVFQSMFEWPYLQR